MALTEKRDMPGAIFMRTEGVEELLSGVVAWI